MLVSRFFSPLSSFKLLFHSTTVVGSLVTSWIWLSLGKSSYPKKGTSRYHKPKSFLLSSLPPTTFVGFWALDTLSFDSSCLYVFQAHLYLTVSAPWAFIPVLGPHMCRTVLDQRSSSMHRADPSCKALLSPLFWPGIIHSTTQALWQNSPSMSSRQLPPPFPSLTHNPYLEFSSN